MCIYKVSAKSRALRAHVPTYLACLRAHVPTCLLCSRAHALTCSHAHVPTCLACLRVHVLQLQITKTSFQWYVLLRFLVLLLWFFPLEKETLYKKRTTSRNVSKRISFENSVVHSYISLARRKPLTGATTNFVQ